MRSCTQEQIDVLMEETETNLELLQEQIRSLGKRDTIKIKDDLQLCIDFNQILLRALTTEFS